MKDGDGAAISGRVDREVRRLPVERLRWTCDPDELGFETTDEVLPLDQTIGQGRGLGAIEFGLRQTVPGYNLYVVGPTGTGRSTAVRTEVARAAAGRPGGSDWCYVHNFFDPYRPTAVEVPAGKGPELARDMELLISTCQRDIPKAFESEQYEQRRSAVIQGLQNQRDAVLDVLRPFAEQLGFIIQLTPVGLVSIPTLAPGVPMSSEAFELLPEEQKKDMRARGQRLQQRMDEAVGTLRRLDREGAGGSAESRSGDRAASGGASAGIAQE